MIEIKGYKIKEEIYGSAHVVVFRAFDEKNDRPVIVKTQRSLFPTIEELNRFEHDYEIGSSISDPGVISYYSIESVEHKKAIIMEDIDGISLQKYLLKQKPPLPAVLKLVVDITTIIDSLHKLKIIHKDISPGNIIVNSQLTKVMITDFGIAARVTREMKSAASPDKLEGNLSYISPEQTGRMNRSVDYRSDFYSLGITFYELLTGEPPFNETDPIELIHAHIARQPRSPSTVEPAIPFMVSEIVMKLLSKTAEDRYQSARGLISDIEKCLFKYLSSSSIESFIPGKNDIPDTFQIPENFYGREKEIASILNQFASAKQRKTGLVFIGGAPGIGKSYLINEIKKKVLPETNFFISGKFEQLKKNIPYSGIIQSFQQIISFIFSENDKTIDSWRTIILSKLGENGRILTDLIPDLTLLIGQQPPVPEILPSESNKRFNNAFVNLIEAFASGEKPLILFLDDLQWADSASIKLLDFIFRDGRLQSFMFIGAYRDNELINALSLERFLDDFNSAGFDHLHLVLDPLSTEQINCMIADTLFRKSYEIEDLSNLIKRKTSGNPFFIKEFLMELYDQKLIFFDRQWEYNYWNIVKADITENVVHLLIKRIGTLPVYIIEVLKIASCVGNSFTSFFLTEITNKTSFIIVECLNRASDEGFVIKYDNFYRFVHDRIKDAIYSLIEQQARIEIHYTIGKLLLQKRDVGSGDESSFAIVNQLDLAMEIITSPEERVELAELNLKVGLKAKAASAYESASEYLRKAIELLPDTKWNTHYDDSIILFTELGEVSYLMGNNADAQKFLNEVEKYAVSVLDKAKVYEIELGMHTSLHQMKEALRKGISALTILDHKMPSKANKLRIIYGILRMKFILKKKNNEALLSIPEMTDQTHLAVSRILMASAEPCYIGDPDYYPIIILKLLHFSLKNGNSKYAAFAYVNYALILTAALGDIDLGHKVGRFALDLIDRMNAKELKCKIYFIFGNFINHWKYHMKDDIEFLWEAYSAGNETGDATFSSYALNHYLSHLFFIGNHLENIKIQYSKYYDAAKKTNQLSSIDFYELWYQLITNLLSEGNRTEYLSGPIFDEEKTVSEWKKASNFTTLGFYTVAKLILHYFHGNFKKAVEVSEQGASAMLGVMGMIFIPQYYYFSALSYLAISRESEGLQKKKYLKKEHFFEKKMKKWAKHSPGNYENKYLLLVAERYAVSGKKYEKTVKLYDSAIELAKKNGFLHEEAIANERAACYLIDCNQSRAASAYLQSAYYLYGLWGARFKVRQMEKDYPLIIVQDNSLHNQRVSVSIQRSAELDLKTVLKASQAISGEIILEKLLIDMLKIAMQNAGARRGILILERDGQLFVTAEGSFEQGEYFVLHEHDVRQSSDIPIAIINYVYRSREPVILNNAVVDGLFVQDTYIKSLNALSVLCVPLIKQQELKGILYLENSLMAGAFPSDRIEIIKLLSTQIAISIDNALLFEKKSMAEIELQQNYEEIQSQYEELESINNELAKTTTELLDANESLAIFKKFAEASGNALCMSNLNGDIVYANSAFARYVGSEGEELKNVYQYYTDGSHQKLIVEIIPFVLKKEQWAGELNMSNDSSGIIPSIQSIFLIRDNHNAPQYIAFVITDITERKKLEEQLIQSQKMEAVGTLTGGIAHDFNNLLTAIIGFGSILKMDIPEEDERSGLLNEMMGAAEKSISLTRQLLAFSRKEHLKAVLTDINLVVANMQKLLKRLLGENIIMRTVLDPDIKKISADPMQLEQVMMNLLLNSRDAMGAGGVLTISTSNVPFGSEKHDQTAGLLECDYIMLAVEDSGTGMNEDIKSKIFEPFFSTKEAGVGTGLGLSVVYGIIKQHNGIIDVHSELGKGTTFYIFIPVEEKKDYSDEKIEKKDKLADLRGSGERILLIEDQENVNSFATKALVRNGYNVVPAHHPVEAIKIFEEGNGNFDLVFSDVVMPGMNGIDLINKLYEIKHDFKVIFCSGYPEKQSQWDTIVENGYPFLKKPYSLENLLKTVKDVLKNS